MKNAYIEEVEGCKLDLESAKTSLETWYAKRYPEAEIVGSAKDWPPNYFPKCWHAVKETLMILTLWPPGTRRSISDTWEMQRRALQQYNGKSKQIRSAMVSGKHNEIIATVAKPLLFHFFGVIYLVLGGPICHLIL